MSCFLRSGINAHGKSADLPSSMSMEFLVRRTVISELPVVETGVLGSFVKQNPEKGNPSPSTRLKKYLLCFCSLNKATPA